MSLAEIREATVQAQTDRELGVGFWLRGDELVFVYEVSKEWLGWFAQGGAHTTAKRETFLREPITNFAGVLLGGSYLDHAWGIASARYVDKATRAIALGRTLQRAPGESERLTVRRWISNLAGGLEPTR